MHPVARRQRLEVLAGVIAVFALGALVNAVGLILAGRASVLASVVLMAALALCWLVWKTWRRSREAAGRRQ